MFDRGVNTSFSKRTIALLRGGEASCAPDTHEPSVVHTMTAHCGNPPWVCLVEGAAVQY